MLKVLDPQHPDHTGSGNSRIPLTLGVLIMAYSLLDVLRGGSALTRAITEPEQSIGSMSFLCGIYLFLTGVWLATRDSLTIHRAIGLTLMLAGILGGTWAGIRLAIFNHEDFTAAYTVFFLGLATHLLGVLYVRKE